MTRPPYRLAAVLTAVCLGGAGGRGTPRRI
jgi:hypothetical protein